jgi:hypothetical protein
MLELRWIKRVRPGNNKRIQPDQSTQGCPHPGSFRFRACAPDPPGEFLTNAFQRPQFRHPGRQYPVGGPELLDKTGEPVRANSPYKRKSQKGFEFGRG